jgi:hypothetical protein
MTVPISPKPLVTDASNAKQSRNADQRAKDILETRQADLKELMKLPTFRRFLWRLLELCNSNARIFCTGSEIYSLATKHDLGVEIEQWASAADLEAFFQMQREAKHDLEK